MSSIGKRIRIRREELNLSQDELARKLGYKSRSSINKIELDQRNLTQSKIKAIADALQTTPAFIMGWEELDQQIDTVKLSESVSRVDQLSKMFIEEYGESVWDALCLYLELDSDDQGEIRGEMKQMLKSVKYSTQEGLISG